MLCTHTHTHTQSHFLPRSHCPPKACSSIDQAAHCVSPEQNHGWGPGSRRKRLIYDSTISHLFLAGIHSERLELSVLREAVTHAVPPVRVYKGRLSISLILPCFCLPSYGSWLLAESCSLCTLLFSGAPEPRGPQDSQKSGSQRTSLLSLKGILRPHSEEAVTEV